MAQKGGRYGQHYIVAISTASGKIKHGSSHLLNETLKTIHYQLQIPLEVLLILSLGEPRGRKKYCKGRVPGKDLPEQLGELGEAVSKKC